MSRACDRYDPSKAKKWLMDGSTTVSQIPTIDVDQRDLQRRHVVGHVAQAPDVERETALFAATVVGASYFYQEIDAVQKQQAKKIARHVVNFRSTRQAKQLCPRKDINEANPIELPIHDCSSESAAQMEKFDKAIKKYLVDKMKMRLSDWDLVRYYGFFWEVGAGMGTHADGPTERCKELFFLRLIISVGGSRTIKFSAHKFPNPNRKPEDRNFTLKAFDIGTLKTRQGADAYLTSPFGNGKLPFCYFDEKKDAGLQAKHEVMIIKPEEEETANIIIDFPLRTMGAVDEALRVMKKETFSFDLEECTVE